MKGTCIHRVQALGGRHHYHHLAHDIIKQAQADLDKIIENITCTVLL